MEHTKWHDSGLAANTIIAYTKGWTLYASWCCDHDLPVFEATPHRIVDFFRYLDVSSRKLSLGTLTQYRSALTWQFRNQGFDSPPTRNVEVDRYFRSLARRYGRRKRQVNPLLADHIESINVICPPTLIGIRDSALLSIGFAGALRRSELVALRLSDISVPDNREKGMFLKIRRSKTDQAGQGYEIPILDGVRIQAVTRLRVWIEAAKLGGAETPLFQGVMRGGHANGKSLNHDSVSRIVKKYADQIGLDAAQYSAHSLRAGFVTSAAMAGARIDKIMDVSRHASTAMVMQYIRDAKRFENHAGESFL